MASAIAYPVRAPQWVLTYKGVNITEDISAMVTSITYLDRLDGASGTLEVELEDHDKRWQGAWQPTEGDQVDLMMGYAGSPLLPCGDFQVDDLSLTGPPDLFHLRCLAAFITPTMRTPNSAGYEGQTLTQIASTIASKHGLSLVGVGDTTNLTFARITQRQETDLAFLRRLARAHNYEFTHRGKQLVFYPRGLLEASAPVATIGRADLLSFDFRLKTHRIYKAVEVSYQFANTKQLLTQTAVAGPAIASVDTLKLVVRCENGQQASLKAVSALHGENMVRASATVTAVGSIAYAAGNVVTMQEFGFNDGSYLIESARHRLERATGYTTEITMRSVE
jgi:phage protein D